MQLKNTLTRYGVVAKFFHWVIFLFILNQYVAAIAMLNTAPNETTLSFTQGALYNWHKSIGIIILVLAMLRYTWRKITPVPDWAPNLSDREKRSIHWIERILYICMFLMPISGFVFVMTGGYGVNFFSSWQIPNFLGENETIALIAQWTHRITAYLIVFTLVAHWTLGIRHAIVYKDRYLRRMLPFTRQQ